jgi:hypothetical protein
VKVAYGDASSSLPSRGVSHLPTKTDQPCHGLKFDQVEPNGLRAQHPGLIGLGGGGSIGVREHTEESTLEDEELGRPRSSDVDGLIDQCKSPFGPAGQA